MSFFNPSKYSSSSSYTEEMENIEEKVEKGHKNKMKIDIGKFEEFCKKFRNISDLKIKSLTGQDKEDFNIVVSYVHLLYGTDYYSKLFEKVKKQFKNLKSVVPGTVGSYFAGCLISKDESSVSNSCSISCAGSMPLPRGEEGWSFCDKAVLLAERGKKGYDFSVVKPANTEEEMDPAYLFIESESLQDFSGFSQSEKDHLRAYGCKKVKLIGYKNDHTYSELYKAPKAIHEIKHRHVKENHKKDSNATVVTIVIIMILILLLLLIFAGYRYYNSN